ncbi:MAG TPA: class I SAM-dependent methyltransferase, partial [Vicinamibacterales bacterium]|nr:class I SAM-dependent methyltransferase [Vicinamibacterales bacterium]
MPTVAENRNRWRHHKWAQQGDEWSPGRSSAGTAALWYRTILPRIERFVPAGTILEVGPGFGRWTQYLHRLCDRLIVIDLSERCIAACRDRFADESHLEYIVNDGASLAMIPDGSVDFLFSFDSLVHAESDAVGAYLAQAAHKLKPGGAGFVHHSNLGAFVHPRTGQVRRFVTHQHWRAESMSADVFARLCDQAGLACRSQELINWIGRGRNADRHHLDGRCIPLTDCLSVFTTRDGPEAPLTLIANFAFVEEWRQAVWMAEVYLKDIQTVSASAAVDDRQRLHPLRRKVSTARAVLQREGLMAAAALAWHGVSAAIRFTISA